MIIIMKISTKGRYGLRLMIELALSYPQRLIPLKEIAQSQNISVKYLEQIITSLGRHGLVSSVRGAQGGYTLSRPPQEISVRDILSATEENLTLVGCLEEGCDRQSCCMANQVWRQISDVLNQTAAAISLADIISQSTNK